MDPSPSSPPIEYLKPKPVEYTATPTSPSLNITEEERAAMRIKSLGAEQRLAEQKLQQKGLVEKTKKVVVDYWKVILAVVLVLFVLLFVLPALAERFTNRTVDMIAFRNPDPTLYKYTNRVRDPSGMDLDDYYLEGDMTYKYGLGPELLGDAAFQARVVTEGTMLKGDVSTNVDATPVSGSEDFVGGLSY